MATKRRNPNSDATTTAVAEDHAAKNNGYSVATDPVPRALGLVLGGVVAVALFGIVRRLPRTWWIWGAIVSMFFLMVGVAIAPIYIFPIFNKITRLDNPNITRPIARVS